MPNEEPLGHDLNRIAGWVEAVEELCALVLVNIASSKADPVRSLGDFRMEIGGMAGSARAMAADPDRELDSLVRTRFEGISESLERVLRVIEERGREYLPFEVEDEEAG